MDRNLRTFCGWVLFPSTNSTQTVLKILEEVDFLDCKNEDGYPPLHLACRYGCVEAVQAILKLNHLYATSYRCRFELERIGKREINRTPLHDVSESNMVNDTDSIKIAKLLLDAGADMFAKDADGACPLYFLDNKEMLSRMMIKRWMSQNGRLPTNHEAVLHYAAKFGLKEELEMLLKLGIDPNSKDNDGKTPLMWTFMPGAYPSEDLAKILLKHGAKPFASHPRRSSASMFLLACEQQYFDVAEVLLMEHGFDVNARDANGQDVLDYLCGCDSLSEKTRRILALLLKNGLVLDYVNSLGETMLHKACLIGEPDFIHEILRSGCCDVNAVTREGESALTLASVYYVDLPAILPLLIEYGADIHHSNDSNWTALHWAVTNKKTSDVALLLSYGARADIKNSDGNTPLDIAEADDDVDLQIVSHLKQTIYSTKRRKLNTNS